MNANLPKDPAMLLSVVNTKLRDYYFSLDDFCQAEDVNEKELKDALSALDYVYNEETNQFE
ncbi:MAG: DUF4250 domain-containing protein [Lachnospiraceae bacterium]|nr:DUF4250 domain-containing protein [Lachnospiraceae bacterium]